MMMHRYLALSFLGLCLGMVYWAGLVENLPVQQPDGVNEFTHHLEQFQNDIVLTMETYNLVKMITHQEIPLKQDFMATWTHEHPCWRSNEWDTGCLISAFVIDCGEYMDSLSVYYNGSNTIKNKAIRYWCMQELLVLNEIIPHSKSNIHDYVSVDEFVQMEVKAVEIIHQKLIAIFWRTFHLKRGLENGTIAKNQESICSNIELEPVSDPNDEFPCVKERNQNWVEIMSLLKCKQK